METHGLLMYSYEGEPFATAVGGVNLTGEGHYSIKLKQYFIGLLEQVVKLHHAKFVHLDIKPSNVLVKMGNDDSVITTVIDYEFVANSDSKISRRGSPGFWPPEMTQGVAVACCSMDMYSVAKTLLCEAVNKFQRKAPFEQEADVSQWVEEVHGGWRQDVDSELREFLVGMVSACLAIPDRRWSAELALKNLCQQ